MLEVQDLVKTFETPDGVVCALDGVTLALKARELVAVRGPSGCGKTSLLLTIGALMRPSSGLVRVGGDDPYALSPDERARFRAERIGFVFQQFHLVPYLSVLENVLAPALAKRDAAAGERARELIARFGLEPRARHLPSALSTGERQRTALARALLNRPALLLADEPTGNLDDANAETVLRYLAEFADEGGAVLLVGHDVRGTTYAERVLSMEAGRITPP